MTVAELVAVLKDFPPDFPVFFSPDDEGRVAVAPRDAVMNLVHPVREEVIADNDSSSSVPEGFVDSVVIYPRVVREEVAERSTAADHSASDALPFSRRGK